MYLLWQTWTACTEVLAREGGVARARIDRGTLPRGLHTNTRIALRSAPYQHFPRLDPKPFVSVVTSLITATTA